MLTLPIEILNKLSTSGTEFFDGELPSFRQKNVTVIALDDDESNELLHTGVIGTFVLALEDQYQSVRIAAVQSIQQLSTIRYPITSHGMHDDHQSSSRGSSDQSDDPSLLSLLRMTSYTFSRTALSHLINIFSDDIDQVRQCAIDAVTHLGNHGISSMSSSPSSSSLLSSSSPNEMLRFNEEQLQIILVLLEDSNVNIRSSVHSLLSVVHLSNSSCVHAAIRALLTTNMNKYPSDLPSIYRTLKHLGLNHHSIVELLIEELLRLERYYMLPEQMVDDLYYTGILIVIMNAVSLNTNILNHLPSHIYGRHYDYMRNKWNHHHHHHHVMMTTNGTQQQKQQQQQQQVELFPQLHITLIEQSDDHNGMKVLAAGGASGSARDKNRSKGSGASGASASGSGGGDRLQRPGIIPYAFQSNTMATATITTPQTATPQSSSQSSSLSLSQYVSSSSSLSSLSSTMSSLSPFSASSFTSSSSSSSLTSLLRTNLSFIRDLYLGGDGHNNNNNNDSASLSSSPSSSPSLSSSSLTQCYESVRLLHEQLSSSGMSDSLVHYYQLHVQCLYIYMKLMNEWHLLTNNNNNSSSSGQNQSHGTHNHNSHSFIDNVDHRLTRIQSYVNTILYLTYKMDVLFSADHRDHGDHGDGEKSTHSCSRHH